MLNSVNHESTVELKLHCYYARHLSFGVFSSFGFHTLKHSFFLYSLFHVVVENDDISTKIIGHLNAQKGGRVTFVPLNRVKAPHVTYPQSSDVIPLLKKLNFLEKYRAAFGQVWLLKCLCCLHDNRWLVGQMYLSKSSFGTLE